MLKRLINIKESGGLTNLCGVDMLGTLRPREKGSESSLEFECLLRSIHFADFIE